MISCFIQEQKRYTLAEIKQLLKLNDEQIVALLKKLKVCNIVKAVKATDVQKQLTELLDEDVAVADVITGQTELYYVFTFVGVLVVSGRILKCYPKYLSKNNDINTAMKQILRVLEKYNSNEQIVRMFTEVGERRSFNLLAVMLALLTDYHEYGLYNNEYETIECNGMGEILWDRTINDTFAVLQGDRPYYVEIQTKKRIQDDFDYFRRLHACVLTVLSKDLSRTDLPDLFDIATVDLSDETLDEFGDQQYILDRIEKELNVEFGTRKQYVLKTIYAYIRQQGTLADRDCFAVFGTTGFNLVWEKVCSEVLSNQLHLPLGALKLPVPLKQEYHPGQELIDVIEKPIWYGTGYEHIASDTLIPDAITIEEKDGEYRFLIYDAKYYIPCIEGNKPLSWQPGIESITKQYLYQLAYTKFIKDHQIDSVDNCFLFPTEKDCIIEKGRVSLPMMDAMGLKAIRNVFLPAKVMYQCYLGSMHLSSSEVFGS